jgi:hypothetical protein
MKKPESFDILCKGRKIYSGISEEEMFEIMDDLALQYYETGVPNPVDLMVECTSTEE